jgi:hypothetical protein
MAKSTGPILAVGGVTLLNGFLINRGNMEIVTVWPTVAATGLAAGAFALIERVNQPLTVGVAWVALITALFVRLPMPDGSGRYRHTLVETLLWNWEHREEL